MASEDASTYRDPPGVVGDQQGRVQDPPNSVVDPLAVRVRLVSTLVRNDPDSSHHESLGEPVGTPCGPLCRKKQRSDGCCWQVVGEDRGGRVGEEVISRVNEIRSSDKSSDHHKVQRQVSTRLESRLLEAVCRDSRAVTERTRSANVRCVGVTSSRRENYVQQVLDGEVGDMVLLLICDSERYDGRGRGLDRSGSK